MRRVLDPYADIKSRHFSKTDGDFPFYHHITAAELREIFTRYDWEWGAYWKFCIVRNPWDRLVSVYHHWVRIKSGKGPDAGWKRNVANFIRSRIQPLPSFLEFVKTLDQGTETNLRTGGLASPLTRFIHDEHGHMLVDDVIKFEEMHHVLPGYLRQLGIANANGDLPHLNRSKRQPYQQYYDDEARQIVADLYRFEIENFGYTFE